MSRPRYGWWSYVKYMIRKYPEHERRLKELRETRVTSVWSELPKGKRYSFGDPTSRAATLELPPTEQREFEAVAAALDQTMKKPAGEERIRLVKLIFWERSCNLEGAALKLHLSETTACRWHGEFIRLTAKHFGLLDTKGDFEQ